MITIDEAIQLFRNKALEHEREADLWFSSCGKNSEFGISYTKAAMNNYQIANWLIELKEIKGL